MSISNTTGVGNKPDLTYNLKHLAPSKTPLKPVVSSPPIDDILSISHEAKALYEEEKEKYLGINDYSQEELDAMLEQLNSSADDDNNPMKIMLQCLQIAMRIISGDNVPSRDRAFLAEHEPDMLGRAMLLRRQKDDPKNYKSLLEDDKAKDSDDASPVSSGSSIGAVEEAAATGDSEVSVDVEA